jgi:hypothetical protein
MSASAFRWIEPVTRVPIAPGADASRFRSPLIRPHRVVRDGATWAGRHVLMFHARARIPEIGPGRNFARRCEHDAIAAPRWLASASVIESEVQGGLVLLLSLGSEPVRARITSWTLGSAERGGVPRLASRARSPAAPVRPSADRAGRSCALLATLSRALPRRAWAAFSVRPETLLRWHRQRACAFFCVSVGG